MSNGRECLSCKHSVANVNNDRSGHVYRCRLLKTSDNYIGSSRAGFEKPKKCPLKVDEELDNDLMVYGTCYCLLVDGVKTRLDPTKLIVKTKKKENKCCCQGNEEKISDKL